MKRKTIDIITLGCSKNLVDSEHLMRQLEEVGFKKGIRENAMKLKEAFSWNIRILWQFEEYCRS